MKSNSRTFSLRQRICNNLHEMADKFHRKENLGFTIWNFDWNGKSVCVYLQRYCNGRRRGQINFISITHDYQRMLLRDLFKLANHLTDIRNAR